MNVARAWTPDDDEFLLTRWKGPIPKTTICSRLGFSEAECAERYKALKEAQKQATPPAAAESSAQEQAPDNEERPMDPLQLVLLDFCKNYNLLGQSLEIFSTFISQSVTYDQLMHEAEIIEKFRQQCVEPPAAHRFLATQLHARYILVPRPLVKPQDEPTPQPE